MAHECCVDGCDRPKSSRGYCSSHHRRVLHHGDARADIPLRTRSFSQRACAVPSCDRPAKTRGWCRSHYQRWRKTGDVQEDKPLAPRGQVCSVSECDRQAEGGRGYCHFHYERWRRTGDANWKPQPKIHEPRRTSQGYMAIWTGQRYEAEHRVVWEARHGPLLPGQNIHHKNGDRADNRLENLEIWDTSQPAGQRPQDKVEFAVEMLRRYAPHLLITRWRSRPRSNSL